MRWTWLPHVLGARRWLTFELSGPPAAWPARRIIDNESRAGQAVGGSALERRVRRRCSASRHVSDFARNLNPRVHSLLIDREAWSRELWVRERTDWDSDAIFLPSQRVVHGCAAVGAEVERNACSFVPDADKLLGGARDGDGLLGEASLSAKDAPCATLTGQAVADGDTDWLGGDLGLQLAAATRSDALDHG